MQPISAIIERKRRLLFVLGLLPLVLGAMAGVLFVQKKTATRSIVDEPSTPAVTMENKSAHERQQLPTALRTTEDYIEIESWGVRFKRITGLADVTLVVHENSQTMFFSSEELAALDPNCDAQSGQLGLLERSLTPLDDAAGPRTADVKVGEYFYYYSPPQALCLVAESSATTDNQALADRQQTAVAEAIKTLEAK